MLSMTTLMIGSRTSLPNTNCFIKAIDVYLGICFSFVFGALLEYAVAHYSSLQQMAAKDRVRVLRALCMIHHWCQVLVCRHGLDLAPIPTPPHPTPSDSLCSRESYPCSGGSSWKSWCSLKKTILFTKYNEILICLIFRKKICYLYAA